MDGVRRRGLTPGRRGAGGGVEPNRVIAVTGATGRQGGAVARHLLADGWTVRALTRRPAGRPARRLTALGAEPVSADMADREALLAVFRGAYGVFSVQNPMTVGVEAEVAQGCAVAEAALEAGVRHLVYASAGPGAAGTGVAWWESKRVVEERARRLAVPLTVLRPTAFMELMTDRGYYPALSTWSVMPALMGADRPVPWICVDDVGATAARVFADPETFLGRDVPLAADLRSLAECREIWREVFGRFPRRLPVPVPVFERLAGTELTAMWRWLRTGDVDVDTTALRAIVPSALTVREWLAGRATRRRALDGA